MTCPTCYVNATPEPAAVQVTNVTNLVTIASTAATWVVEKFTLAQSAGGLGLNFFLSQQAAVASEVQVYIGNVPQEPTAAFTIGAARDRVTLTSAMQADTDLIVRYLALLPAGSVWANEVFRLQDSTSQAGLTFTLPNTPTSNAPMFVFKDGVLLTGGGVGYTQTGASIVLTVALTGVEQLIVTYSH